MLRNVHLRVEQKKCFFSIHTVWRLDFFWLDLNQTRKSIVNYRE